MAEKKPAGNPYTHQRLATRIGKPVSPEPPSGKEIAGPMAVGTGDDLSKAGELQRKPYHHPDRVAIRQETAAQERLLRALVAVGGLTRLEQRAFANHLIECLSAGAPLPAFAGIAAEAADWARFASREELQAYIAAAFARLPGEERRKAIKALGRAV